MTTQIRKAVFETNSSSTHSIHIDDGKYVADKMFVDDDGTLRIYPGEFGWGIEDYCDAPSKASYCMTFVYQLCRKWDKDYKEETYIFDDYATSLLNMLTEVLLEETEATSVEYVESNDKYYPYGYIDHQSFDVCEVAFESKEELRKFIFNPKSRLHIDNDNH